MATKIGQNVAVLIAETACDPDESLLKNFLDQGLDVDCTDEKGRTPLILLAREETSDSCCGLRKLLSNGANVNVRDSFGKTALNSINGPSVNVMFNKLKILLTKKADPNLGVFDGDTSLMAAAFVHCKFEVLHTILDYEANPRIWQFPQTYLHCLVKDEHESIIRKLVINGAVAENSKPLWAEKPKRQTKVSPLRTALYYGRTRIAKYFLANFFLTDLDVVVQDSRTTHNFNDKGLELLKLVRSRPWSLLHLSAIAVSKSINSGTDRSSKINGLGVPRDLHDLFANAKARLCINSWDRIDLTHTKGNYWPFVDFKTCKCHCEDCKGEGIRILDIED